MRAILVLCAVAACWITCTVACTYYGKWSEPHFYVGTYQERQPRIMTVFEESGKVTELEQYAASDGVVCLCAVHGMARLDKNGRDLLLKDFDPPISLSGEAGCMAGCRTDWVPERSTWHLLAPGELVYSGDCDRVYDKSQQWLIDDGAQGVGMFKQNFLGQIAREKLLYMAAAAYAPRGSSSGEKVNNIISCLRTVPAFVGAESSLTVWSTSVDVLTHTLEAFVLSDKRDGTVYVTFKGTDGGFMQLWDEIKGSRLEEHTIVLKDTDDAYEPKSYTATFSSLEYFENAYAALSDFVRSSLFRVPATSKVYFVGHSLGGALAARAILDALALNGVWERFHDMHLYTFGAPRAGDARMAVLIDTWARSSYRIVNGDDIVPHLPPCKADGKGCVLQAGHAYHHGSEVWYTDDASYKVCDVNESPECSNSIDIHTSVDDHKVLFGVKFSEYCASHTAHAGLEHVV